MRIVQVAAYYPPRIGGMQNCVREISERLAQNGNLVEVFTSDIGITGGKLSSTDNLKIHYLKGWQFAHTAFIPSLLFKLLRSDKKTIIHVHIAHAVIPEIVFLVSKIRKIPYIAHIHADIEPTGKLGILLPFYKNIFLKRVLRSASKIIVLDKKYKEVIAARYGISKNITVIPNGVSEKFFISKRLLSSKHANLLYVGRLSLEKNVSKLVEAVSLLKGDATLHLVGDGEKRGEIENIVSGKNIKNVILHGNKTGEELISFYQKADIFLLASDHEGLPLVLLEAMASGVPIIASDVIGIREFIKKTGILVSPQTPEEFSNTIEHLLGNKQLRNRLSKEGIKRAKQYDWSRIVKRFEMIYQGSLSKID